MIIKLAKRGDYIVKLLQSSDKAKRFNPHLLKAAIDLHLMKIKRLPKATQSIKALIGSK